MTDEEVLRGIFKTTHLFTIPRPILFRALVNSLRHDGELYLELFCANPDHVVFKDQPERNLAPMRLERLRRIGEHCERYKMRRCKRARARTCPYDCPHAKDHQRQASCLNKPKACGECE